jgi:hypothetical protein
MPLGEMPYITFIHGLPHDPWYYSYDGLNYAFPSSPMIERGRTAPVESFLDVKPDDSYDWIQPNLDPLFNSLPALGKGAALSGTDSYFSPEDMQWHAFSLPNEKTLPGGRIQVDSRGRLHAVRRAGSGFEYLISSDGGRSWKALVVPEAGSPGDFRANAAAGVAAVWVLKGKQDNVYKFDIRNAKPKLMRHYVLGLGDDSRVGTLGTYGVTGGHRWDFSSLGIFPDGRIAVTFMDSTTLMKFPTLATDVVAPALAIELDSDFPD